MPNLVWYCSHRGPRIPEAYPLQPVRPIHAIVHNRIRSTLGAEAAWGLCVADRRDPLPPVVGLSAAIHPAPGSARLARLPGNGRPPLPAPARQGPALYAHGAPHTRRGRWGTAPPHLPAPPGGLGLARLVQRPYHVRHRHRRVTGGP